MSETYTAYDAPRLTELDADLDNWSKSELAIHSAAKLLDSAEQELEDAEQAARFVAEYWVKATLDDSREGIDSTADMMRDEYRELSAITAAVHELRRKLDAFAFNRHTKAFHR